VRRSWEGGLGEGVEKEGERWWGMREEGRGTKKRERGVGKKGKEGKRGGIRTSEREI